MTTKNEIKENVNVSVTARTFSAYDLDKKPFPSTDFKTVTDACVSFSTSERRHAFDLMIIKSLGLSQLV